IFSEVISQNRDLPVYLKSKSATSLAFQNKELEGHGKSYHKDGFSSPIGRLKNAPAPLEDLNDSRLKGLNIEKNKPVTLHFESGVVVKGTLQDITRENNRILLITFTGCRVTYHGKVLFEPSWGNYDMAVGEKIVSVFSGAADKDAYDQPSRVSKTRTGKATYTGEVLKLHTLFQKIRGYRNGCGNSSILLEVWDELKRNFPGDWLLSLEVLEILEKECLFTGMAQEIKVVLETKANQRKELQKLIDDGLNLIYNI
ncbi:MAG: phenylalanine 4-monooxygenase, partial [bacterium]|nr:phenylalanine 4-monooxygenase [bacterium]